MKRISHRDDWSEALEGAFDRLEETVTDWPQPADMLAALPPMKVPEPLPEIGREKTAEEVERQRESFYNTFETLKARLKWHEEQ